MTKQSDAPSEIAAEARAVGQVYQHWREARTKERDQQLRAWRCCLSGMRS